MKLEDQESDFGLTVAVALSILLGLFVVGCTGAGSPTAPSVVETQTQEETPLMAPVVEITLVNGVLTVSATNPDRQLFTLFVERADESLLVKKSTTRKKLTAAVPPCGNAFWAGVFLGEMQTAGSLLAKMFRSAADCDGR